ncbi:MAG: nitrate reductase molybdenum cofactor assembly chaperone [Planctomycetota bacterium]
MIAHRELASALCYPAGDETCTVLADFPGFEELGSAELEELYTRTFDINPVCSLEVGWHLFGEDYNRGAFLVRMRGLLREHGIEEGAELPDHLESVLRVLDVMDRGKAAELAREFVLPAVLKMRAPFGEGTNPYANVLAAVESFLRDTYGEPVEWIAPTDNTPYDCGGCHGIC